MARFKVLLVVVLAVLLVIVILQNTEIVDTRLLFVTVSMPRAALLGFAVLFGFVLGVLTDYWLGRKKAQK